jgi:hypothetical protein
MHVKHVKIKLIDDVDSFLEHLKLLLGGRLSGTWGRGHKGT